MSKLNLVKEGILNVERDEQDRPTWVHFTFNKDKDAPHRTFDCYDNQEIEDAKSAMRAAADLMSYDHYGHPDTDMVSGTVFVKTAVGDDFYVSDAGYVTYENDDPKFPEVTLKEYPSGVAWLHRRNGRYFLSPVPKSRLTAVRAKIDWMQAIIHGYNFSIRVVPFAPYAEVILNNLAIEDFDERLAARYANLKRSFDKKSVSRAVGKGLRAIEAGEREKPTGPIVVKLFGTKDTVDITTLEPQQIFIHSGNGNPFPETWVDNPNKRLAFQRVAERGWEVELRSVQQ